MIRLYLLGEKGYYILKRLNNIYNYLIDDVVIGTDKNIYDDFNDKIKLECDKRNLISFENNNIIACKSKYSIAISWKKIINDNNTLVVIHDSILPKYRGFNPLVSALIKGDKHIGASSIIAKKEYDTGPIIKQESIKIDYPITIKKAIELLKPVYYELFFDIILKIAKHERIISTDQNEERATYSLWRNEDDYIIDWNKNADYIKRFIDAVGTPYNGAKTFFKGKPLRIYEADVADDVKIENRTPGKVIFKRNNNFYVVCGKGILAIKEFYNEADEIVDFKNKFRIKFGK